MTSRRGDGRSGRTYPSERVRRLAPRWARIYAGDGFPLVAIDQFIKDGLTPGRKPMSTLRAVFRRELKKTLDTGLFSSVEEAAADLWELIQKENLSARRRGSFDRDINEPWPLTYVMTRRERRVYRTGPQASSRRRRAA